MATNDNRHVIAVADAAELANAAAKRLLTRIAANSGRVGDLPDRGIEPEAAAINCSPPTATEADPVGAHSLVQSAMNGLCRQAIHSIT